MNSRSAVAGFTVGLLLSTALLRLLPGAFSSGEDARVLLASFLAGLVVVFAAHKLVLTLAGQGWAHGRPKLAALALLPGVCVMGPLIPVELAQVAAGFGSMVAGSFLVYTALAGLVPRLHFHLGKGEILWQSGWLLGGVLLGGLA